MQYVTGKAKLAHMRSQSTTSTPPKAGMGEIYHCKKQYTCSCLSMEFRNVIQKEKGMKMAFESDLGLA